MQDDEFQPVPRQGAELPTPARVQALADSLDYMLQSDLCALAAVKNATVDAWAKRGEGPPYVMLGNRRLYPRDGVRRFLADRVRTRTSVDAGTLL